MNTKPAASNSRDVSLQHADAEQPGLVDSLVRSSAMVILARRGHTDPFASALVAERFEDIVGVANQSVKYHAANLEKDEAGEEIRRTINSAVFTFATDALYILSDTDKDLQEQRRQFNAFLSLAESRFEKAIADMRIPDSAAEAGRESFRKTRDVAYDYFARPRVAVLDTVRSQQTMSADLVRLQQKLENRTVDFERFAGPYLQVLTNDPKDVNLSLLKSAAETFGKAYADTAMLNFAAGNGAFKDPASPINAIAPAASQGATAAGEHGLMIDYTPESGFDALSILQNFWKDPHATIAPGK